LSLNIHPLFVFDGPNKPLFKRNRRVGGPGAKVVSVPEFLAKQLLQQFGFPMHVAPGEAEAECALLQREGIVDAVLSEDVDTLMFGSGVTMRSWTPEKSSNKVPTHVNVHDAQSTKETSGLDREGMILIALMSGGDYIPEGIPGCGPKTACEVARAGFGAELCKLRNKDDAGFKEWRERLKHELWTNESKMFKSKRRLDIPDDFPSREVLGYYTKPCISTPERLIILKQNLKWDQAIDFPSLRSFTADAFDWTCIGGAKKFIRNMAPAILLRELRLRAERTEDEDEDRATQKAAEDRLVIAFHGKRSHASTDHTPELRVSFLPLNIINLDLSQELPDEIAPTQGNEYAESDGEDQDIADVEPDITASPSKRGPSKYNPAEVEKIWLIDEYLRKGVPIKVQDWEASFRDPKTFLAAKRAAKEVGGRSKKKVASDMPRGALDRFTQVTKPGLDRPSSQLTKPSSSTIECLDMSTIPSTAPLYPTTTKGVIPGQSQRNALSEINLAFIGNIGINSTETILNQNKKRSSPDPLFPASHTRLKANTPKKSSSTQPAIIDLLSSPPPTERQSSFRCSTPGKNLDDHLLCPLPDTVTKRRRKSPTKSPFRRYDTAPAVLGDDIATAFMISDDDDDVNDCMTYKSRRASTLEDNNILFSPFPLLKPSDSSLLSGNIIKTPLPEPTIPYKKTLSDKCGGYDSDDLPSPSIFFSKPSVQKILQSPLNKTIMNSTVAGSRNEKSGGKKYYQVRKSLQGTWKEVDGSGVDVRDVEVADLTSYHHDTFVNPTTTTTTTTTVNIKDSNGISNVKNHQKSRTKDINIKRTIWRKSEVEIVDLTGDGQLS